MLTTENAKYGTDYGLDMVDPSSSSVFAQTPRVGICSGFG